MNEKKRYTLPEGTILEGKDFSYKVVKVLGRGAFGITYQVELLGKNGQSTDMYMAMKEFFMKDFNGRDGKTVTASNEDGFFKAYRNKFLDESKILSDVRHDNIVSIKEMFEANNTVYYLMGFIKGGSLQEAIDQRGALSERDTLEIAESISSALAYLHTKGIAHLDVKPGNVMMISGRVPVLIDFGLSKHFNPDGEPESSTSIGSGTRGFAPIEQANYEQNDEVAEQIDVYALGATMLNMLTGHRPPDASYVFNKGFPETELSKKGVSKDTIAVIKRAMAPALSDRYANMGGLKDAIDAVLEKRFGKSRTELASKEKPEVKIAPAVTPNTADTQKEATTQSEELLFDDYEEEKQPHKPNVVLYVMSALLIVVAGLVIYFFFLGRTESKIEQEEAADTPAVAAPVANTDTADSIAADLSAAPGTEYDAQPKMDKRLNDKSLKDNRKGVAAKEAASIVPGAQAEANTPSAPAENKPTPAPKPAAPESPAPTTTTTTE